MWFLVACLYETCLAPQAMPSREACAIVGGELGRAVIAGGARNVVCVDADTGETFDVKERKPPRRP